MNRFRDDGPPSKRFRNDRNDFSSRGGRPDRRDAGPRREDRFKHDRGGGGSGRMHGLQDKNPDYERHNTSPSRVLHVRGLREFATENDIVDAVKQFGRVNFVMMIPRNRQALVEFDNVDDAKRVVEFCENNSIFVCGQPAFFNFSTSDSIKRPEGGMGDSGMMGGNVGGGNMGGGNMGGMNSMGNMNSMGGMPGNMGGDNKILCFNILNPKYPITVDVMQTICSPHGDVLRVIVSKNQGVQAMVEFDNVESARKAKQALNGCDVYSGCCTLKIEFARPDITRLNVQKNDKETFDFTNPNPGAGVAGRGALLGDAPRGGGGSWDDGGGMGPNNSYTEPAFFNEPNAGFNRSGGGNHNPVNDRGSYNNSSRFRDDNFNGGGYGRDGRDGRDSRRDSRDGRDGREGRDGGRGGRMDDDMGRGFGDRGGFSPRGGGFGRGGGRGPMRGPAGMHGMGGPGDGPEPGSVLIVYGLASGKFNCDKLFNVFCIYGNVVKVKMLRSKEGGAMINMQDRDSCERAVMNLNNSFFFDSKLSVVYSKQDFVILHPSPNTLDDGTPSAKDYSDSRNNRFFNPESIGKTRFSPPTKVLHFFNAPPSSEEKDLMKVFEESKAPKPSRVRIFPVKPGAKSAAGLIEFEGVAEACEAVVASNHHTIPNPSGRMPYSLKLSFSASPIIDRPERRGGDR